MESLTLAQLRTGIANTAQQLMAPDQIAVTIAAALLATVFLLAVATIVRGRRRRVIPLPSPTNTSGFTRWLTPLGMKSIPAEQLAAAAAAVRPRRKSGSMKTIKVSTPVSKVPTRALRKAGADALEIARKTGLARDAVVMMMANANPQAAAAKKQTSAKVAATLQAPARTANTERAMTAPSAYGNAPRIPPPAAAARTLGTQFNARIS